MHHQTIKLSPQQHLEVRHTAHKNMVYIGIKSNNMKIPLYHCNIRAKI